METPEPAAGAPRRVETFLTTRWSIVLAAGRERGPRGRDALEELCRGYWYPLYAFARRRGLGAEEAEDLVQGFFADLLERRDLEKVDPARGRFRAFLIAGLQHFLANAWKRERAQKRGGGHRPLSIDFRGADERYRLDPGHDESPERIFERQWALALLARALEALRQEYASSGKEALFEALAPTLQGEGPSHAELARQLGSTAGAVKVAAHRARKRFRETLRAEIAHTVADPAEVERELEALYAALAGG